MNGYVVPAEQEVCHSCGQAQQITGMYCRVCEELNQDDALAAQAEAREQEYLESQEWPV